MRLAGLAVLGLLLSAPLRAEVGLEAIEWQLAAKVRGRAPVYAQIKELKLPDPRLAGRLRVRLTLANRGPKAVEGILLRYGLSARLVPGKGGEGVWAVPFMIEEKRVPMVGPNESREVSLDPALLPAYLKRIFREGYRADQLRLLVMIEPRPGQDGPLRTLESALPVLR